MGAVLLQQFHLHMVQRVEIGKAVANRPFQEGIALQQPLMTHDVQQLLDRTLPFAADPREDIFTQRLVRHEFGITGGNRD
jgi:hypothetical protein